MKLLCIGVMAVLGLFSVNIALADQNPSSQDRTLSGEGDQERGRKVFFRCQTCHQLDADKPARIGPNLNNLFGRKAGEAPGYERYSRALREAEFIWTEQKLDEWLRDPRGFLPGNKMVFQGIRSDDQRKDLLAYLRSLDDAGGR